MNTKINGTVYAQTRVFKGASTGKLIDGRPACCRKRRGSAKVAALKPIVINGEKFYPESMIAAISIPARDRRDFKKLKAARRETNFNITCGDQVWRKAFHNLDGHWFTTEREFNAMLKERGERAWHFPDIVRI